MVDPGSDLLVVTANGYGKRTPLKEYTPKGRATGGIATIAQKTIGVTGPIAAARVVRDGDDLTIITSGGMAMRTEVKEIRQAGRATMGTHVIHLKEGDSVASIARIAAEDLPEEEGKADEKGAAASDAAGPPAEKTQ